VQELFNLGVLSKKQNFTHSNILQQSTGKCKLKQP
jgi:hypothetical protein